MEWYEELSLEWELQLGSERGFPKGNKIMAETLFTDGFSIFECNRDTV